MAVTSKYKNCEISRGSEVRHFNVVAGHEKNVTSMENDVLISHASTI